MCTRHSFTFAEVQEIRSQLLTHYREHQRLLPWRFKAKNEADDDVKGYAVWVSEIMLQQTQVSVVVDYYNRWMQKWPTLKSLALANEEEVAEVWSGLGYYSRSRRLLGSVTKIVASNGGHMPRTKDALLKTLLGVGPYTASAIASIAYNQVVGVVDGNVMRILSRVRCIGAPINQIKNGVQRKFWELANEVVDPEFPGDFNQALMDLGATICTPKNPNCSACPIKSLCGAYREFSFMSGKEKVCASEKGKLADIEHCGLCLLPGEYVLSDGVSNYPKKIARKLPKSDCMLCVIFQKEASNDLLMVKRSSDELLGGLWEFPCIQYEPMNYTLSEITEPLRSIMREQLHIAFCHKRKVKQGLKIVHKFSHIHRTYQIVQVTLRKTAQVACVEQEMKWVPKENVLRQALSTIMKKVFNATFDSSKIKKKLSSTS